MRTRYIVCYDISDDQRLRQIYKCMRGYGQHVQYSVFICDLDRRGRVELLADLTSIMHHTHDRVLICTLGPTDSVTANRIEFLGRSGIGLDAGPVVL